ncbi:MAG: hypothetical protein LBF40_09365, partial [Deltaproteobacteria bacterium]|nr:hypothetical protein [Deltaproteobacteria bacterium]
MEKTPPALRNPDTDELRKSVRAAVKTALKGLPLDATNGMTKGLPLGAPKGAPKGCAPDSGEGGRHRELRIGEDGITHVGAEAFENVDRESVDAKKRLESGPFQRPPHPSIKGAEGQPRIPEVMLPWCCGRRHAFESKGYLPPNTPAYRPHWEKPSIPAEPFMLEPKNEAERNLAERLRFSYRNYARFAKFDFPKDLPQAGSIRRMLSTAAPKAAPRAKGEPPLWK